MIAAKELRTEQPTEPTRRLLTAYVQLQQGERLCVSPDDGSQHPDKDIIARRAASCLLAPEPGDRVLVALAPEPFVLAVLERNSNRPAELRLNGDVRLTAPTGKLDVAASGSVTVTAGSDISLLSRALSVKNGATHLAVKQLDAFAASARAGVDKLSLIASSCDVITDRLTQRAKRAYRFIEQLDQLRVGHLDYRAEQLAQIRANTTVMSARQLAKIDGEQIHVG